MSFANLKRNRGTVAELVAAADKSNNGGAKKSYGDDRIWKPTVDDAGNGYAVIRFLPATEGNDLPWGQYWDHGFKGPTGKWYIEKSLTSIGKQDPVSEANAVLWAMNDDKNCPHKKTVRDRKRRLHYVSNILVVSDKKNLENEGKVMLFVYGKKIFDKVMDKMKPEFPDETPMNAFDMWEGADFQLKIRQVDGFRNYDKSEFMSPSVVDEDDAIMEEVYSKLHNIGEFTDPAFYKSYDELAKHLAFVLGEVAPRPTASATVDAPAAMPAAPKASEPAAIAESVPAEVVASKDDDDDAMSFFAKLAAE
jgi:hypothetical protein